MWSIFANICQYLSMYVSTYKKVGIAKNNLGCFTIRIQCGILGWIRNDLTLPIAIEMLQGRPTTPIPPAPSAAAPYSRYLLTP